MQREAMHLFGEYVWHGNVAFAGLTRHSAKQCVYSVVCCVVVVVEFVVVVAFACDECSVVNKRVVLLSDCSAAPRSVLLSVGIVLRRRKRS